MGIPEFLADGLHAHVRAGETARERRAAIRALSLLLGLPWCAARPERSHARSDARRARELGDSAGVIVSFALW